MSDVIDRLVSVSNDISGYVPSIVHAYTNDPTSIDEEKITDITNQLQDLYEELKQDAPGTLVPAIVENAQGIKPVAEPHEEDILASPPMESDLTAEAAANDKDVRAAPPTPGFEETPNEAEAVEGVDKDK